MPILLMRGPANTSPGPHDSFSLENKVVVADLDPWLVHGMHVQFIRNLDERGAALGQESPVSLPNTCGRLSGPLSLR